MIPITDAERIAWQRQAHALLGKLLERAAKEGLPPIRWTVSASLFGETANRQAYTAWRNALGAPDAEHTHTSTGIERTMAKWERYHHVQVALQLTIFDDEGKADDQG